MAPPSAAASNLKAAFAKRKTAKNAKPAAPKKAPPPEVVEEQEALFVRVKKLKRPQDHFPASCVEVIRVKGNVVLSREEVTKPDLIEMTLSRAEEILENGEVPDLY